MYMCIYTYANIRHHRKNYKKKYVMKEFVRNTKLTLFEGRVNLKSFLQ